MCAAGVLVCVCLCLPGCSASAVCLCVCKYVCACWHFLESLLCFVLVNIGVQCTFASTVCAFDVWCFMKCKFAQVCACSLKLCEGVPVSA